MPVTGLFLHAGVYRDGSSSTVLVGQVVPPLALLLVEAVDELDHPLAVSIGLLDDLSHAPSVDALAALLDLRSVRLFLEILGDAGSPDPIQREALGRAGGSERLGCSLTAISVEPRVITSPSCKRVRR